MKILLCIVLLLVVLTLFAVWPGKRRDALRAPFLGRNCAHRGFFGKDQRPPENSLPAFAAAVAASASAAGTALAALTPLTGRGLL